MKNEPGNAPVAGVLIIPDDAKKPHILTHDDGSNEVAWHGSLYDDSEKPDTWLVTVSPDRRSLHVSVEADGIGWLYRIEDTLRNMLRYVSGVQVHLSLRWVA